MAGDGTQIITIVTIEGIPAADGSSAIARFCHPRIPNYATSPTYIPLLSERPQGVAANWRVAKSRASSGRFSLVLRDPAEEPDASSFPVNFWKTRGRPVNEVREAITVGETIWTLQENAGITVGKHYYVGTETIRATVFASAQMTCTRGEAASIAKAHEEAGVDVYDYPVVMKGRKVTVYEVDDRTATGPGDEVVSRSGFIAEEFDARNGPLRWECVQSAEDAKSNRKPLARHLGYTITEGGTLVFRNPIEEPGGSGLVTAPQFDPASTTAYWYAPKYNVMFRGLYSGGWLFDPMPVIGDPADLPGTQHGEDGELKVYEVAYTLGDGTPYGYDDGVNTASRHPIDIVLNHLVSRDGTNFTGLVNWDRATLGGQHALGVDIANVDIDAFVAAKEGPLAGIESKLFYGGDRSESFRDLFHRILAPLGYVVAQKSTGVYTILSIEDIFPDDTVVAITSEFETDPDSWVQYPLSAALDQMIVNLDGGPSGKDTVPAVINIPEVADLYPEGRGVIIGGTEPFENAPYTSRLFDSVLATGNLLLARRARRLATKILAVDLVVKGALYGAIDIGSKVSLLAPGLIRDPFTGDVQTSDSEPALAMVARYTPDPVNRRANITVLHTDTPKVGLISPSATVASYAEATKTLTVNADDHSESGDDATTFRTGAKIWLISERGVLLSTVAESEVASTAATSIVLTAHFQDGLGDMDGLAGRNIPTAGDLIVLADFDTSVADEVEKYTYSAGLATAIDSATLGAANETPYLFGD